MIEGECDVRKGGCQWRGGGREEREEGEGVIEGEWRKCEKVGIECVRNKLQS